MEFTSAADTVRRSGENPSAKWPSRGEANRLEPDCWPTLRPRFKISQGARVYSMGSCFARNIGFHLAAMGFRIKERDLIHGNPDFLSGNGMELVNIYTPTAMLQELLWTKRILDRDDTVREEDVMPHLLAVGPDRYIDLQSRFGGAMGDPPETLLRRRVVKYELNREAFFCDVAIFTVGLIETWWDRLTNQTIEFSPLILRHADSDRFAFRRLRYEEAFAALDQAVATVLENPARRALITTSPVPLSRTFTDDDVIVANAHSKSVLRAVAGEICEKEVRADYFPSYESVMLSKRNEVWSDDLIHVQSTFVGQIMSRFVQMYVADDVGGDFYADVEKLNELVQQGQIPLAAACYERVMGRLHVGVPRHSWLTLAEYEAATGKLEAAGSHLATFLVDAPGSVAPSFLDYLRAGRVCRALGKDAQESTIFEMSLECIRRSPRTIDHALKHILNMKWTVEGDWLVRNAAPLFSEDPIALNCLAHYRRDCGNMAEYDRLKRASLAVRHDPLAYRAYGQELAKNGDVSGAIDLLMQFEGHTTDPEVFRALVRLLHLERRHDEALRLIELRLIRHPQDALAFGWRAMVNNARGRREDAMQDADRAVSLGADMPGLAPLITRLRGRSGHAGPE